MVVMAVISSLVSPGRNRHRRGQSCQLKPWFSRIVEPAGGGGGVVGWMGSAGGGRKERDSCLILLLLLLHGLEERWLSLLGAKGRESAC